MWYKILITIFLTSALLSCQQQKASENEEHAAHQAATASADTTAKKPLSPHRMAMSNIGNTHVHIEYGSPGVRGRVIWGGLVAYNQVWVAGAHNATSIDFSTDVKINGQVIPKGKYAFFTIPGEQEWTLILNKNYEQHLADEYNEKEDILRLKVKPEILPEVQESLTYTVEPINDNKGKISMIWEKVKVSFEVESM